MNLIKNLPIHPHRKTFSQSKLLIVNFIKKELTSILLKIRKWKRTLSNSFYETNVTSITNPAKKFFNFKPMSFMNTDTKILNRILANRI